MEAIHAIILTLNEEIHIARCLESVRHVCATVTIIDSGSTDRTKDIAKMLGAQVITNPWINYAKQMNFGIDHLTGRGGWLLRIDADEYLCPDAIQQLQPLLSSLPADVEGVCLRRRRVFMGRWLRWGGLYPLWLLRLWRNGHGRCEERWMDEHIFVKGKVHHAQLDFADHSLQPISWWSQKHVSYAGREAIDIIAQVPSKNFSSTAMSARSGVKWFIKTYTYDRMPGGLRSLLFFLYRYVLLLGFLDGRPGYFFHVLQCLWYRTLVDAIASDIQSDLARGLPLSEAVRKHTGQDIQAVLRP